MKTKIRQIRIFMNMTIGYIAKQPASAVGTLATRKRSVLRMKINSFPGIYGMALHRSSLHPKLLSWLLLGTALFGTLPSRAENLYNLDTYCSLDGAKAVPCRVAAVNNGDITEYRHSIGNKEVLFRIADQPYTRVELWDPAGKRWQSVSSAAAIFSLNALCLNGTAFCVVNPNYLNSVREDLGRAVNGRDVLEVTFGKDGRINATCYDDGCPDQGKLGQGA